jgi:PHD/YefM family antitoxin component YafN of YafNO toxin-antitoxin module
MYKAMPTLPVTELRANQSGTIAQLDQTPILLTHRGYRAGILVHPDAWNRLIEELEEHRFLREAERRARYANPVADIPFAQLIQELTGRDQTNV